MRDIWKLPEAQIYPSTLPQVAHGGHNLLASVFGLGSLPGVAVGAKVH